MTSSSLLLGLGIAEFDVETPFFVEVDAICVELFFCFISVPRKIQREDRYLLGVDDSEPFAEYLLPDILFHKSVSFIICIHRYHLRHEARHSNEIKREIPVLNRRSNGCPVELVWLN